MFEFIEKLFAFIKRRFVVPIRQFEWPDIGWQPRENEADAAPESTGAPTDVIKPSGRAPDFESQPSETAIDKTLARGSDRAQKTIATLRKRAAHQILDSLGAVSAPSILDSLIEQENDPVSAVSRLIALLGLSPERVAGDVEDERARFLDALDAFLSMEAALKVINRADNKAILLKIRSGHGDDIRARANSAYLLADAENLLRSADIAAPRKMKAGNELKSRIDAIRTALTSFEFPYPAEMQDGAAKAQEAAANLYRIAQAWSAAAEDLAPLWETIDERLGAASSDRLAIQLAAKALKDEQSAIWGRLESARLFENLNYAQISKDFENLIERIRKLAADIEEPRSEGSEGRRRKSGREEKSGSQKTREERWNTIWKMFGFDERPTRALLLKAFPNFKEAQNKYRKIAKRLHPDLQTGEEEKRDATTAFQELQMIWSQIRAEYDAQGRA